MTAEPGSSSTARPTPTAPAGVRLGVDVGSVRVGVALSDPHGILATPLATLARDPIGNADLHTLIGLIGEHNVVEVVVGLPRTLRGELGPAALIAQAYGSALAALMGARPDAAAPDRQVPVEYVDERLTSVTANRNLAEVGVRSRARRAVVDQAAAVAILQSRLDAISAGRR